MRDYRLATNLPRSPKRAACASFDTVRAALNIHFNNVGIEFRLAVLPGIVAHAIEGRLIARFQRRNRIALFRKK